VSGTVAQALTRVGERLGAVGIDSPRVDAEILLAHVLGTSRSGLGVVSRSELRSDDVAALESLVVRRERREPLAYVLGEWGFRRLTLKVDARVLVPRPETEGVVERCLVRVAGISEPRVLDVGTGSGAIALAIADEQPGARVTGIDVSEDALAVARENVARTALPVELIHGDLFEGLPDGPWDLVVSNPPYVRPDEIESLAPEVRDWEPRAALVGDGATEAVAGAALRVLQPGGALVLETADHDAGRVVDLLRGLGFIDLVTTEDLARRDRVVDGVTTRAD
jgi:release factor glutamine methyltransferase